MEHVYVIASLETRAGAGAGAGGVYIAPPELEPGRATSAAPAPADATPAEATAGAPPQFGNVWCGSWEGARPPENVCGGGGGGEGLGWE